MPARPHHKLVKAFINTHRLDWSEHHREVAVSCLNRFTAWLADRGVELADTEPEHCTEYLAMRKQAVSSSTATKDYQFVRWLFLWLDEEDELTGRNPMKGVKGMGKVTTDPDRTPHVTDAIYERVLASFDKRKTLDCRNAAICSLMYWSGARGIEVCRADLAKLDLDARRLTVLGKDGEFKPLFLNEETCRLIERYLRRRGDDAFPPLFLGSFGTASPQGRLKPKAIYDMLRRREAVTGVHVPLHAFRRGMAIGAKRRGISDTSAQVMGRWADSRMLARYQKGAAEELAAAEFHANDPTARQNTRSGRRRLRAM